MVVEDLRRRVKGKAIRCCCCKHPVTRGEVVYKVERCEANGALANGYVVAYVCASCGAGFGEGNHAGG